MILDHVSHSQISMWKRCPKQWEYRYVEGIKIPPSGALVLGSSYHETLELNFKQKMHTQKDLDLADFYDVFSTSWDTRIHEEEEIAWQDNERPHILKDVGTHLVGAYRKEVSPAVQPTSVENCMVTDIGGTKFVYIMDLIDTNEIVIDHKTSGKAYSQADVDKDIQASAAAFMLKRPILFQNHIAVKTSSPYIQIINSIRTDADIDWWLNMAKGIIAHMKTGIAPPNPDGWHCSPNYCGYWNMCRGGLVRKIF